MTKVTHQLILAEKSKAHIYESKAREMLCCLSLTSPPFPLIVVKVA